MDGSFKPPIFSMGIHSVHTYMDIHGLSIKLNKPGYKDCFGRKKMEARRIIVTIKTIMLIIDYEYTKIIGVNCGAKNILFDMHLYLTRKSG